MTLPRTAPYSALLWIDGSRTPALVTILEETARGYLVERRDYGNWDLPPRRETIPKSHASRACPEAATTTPAEILADLEWWRGPGTP